MKLGYFSLGFILLCLTGTKVSGQFLVDQTERQSTLPVATPSLSTPSLTSPGLLDPNSPGVLQQILQPLRQMNSAIRDAVTNTIKRISTLFLPTTTTQLKARNGRMIYNPDLEKIIRHLVDQAFDYLETYYAN